ncbi:hypothetical protein GOBAR_DD26097 [Gossypium barbadense]|nr:hypothetical protein GOBAR_DD26097 [Gossypium barbadense]
MLESTSSHTVNNGEQGGLEIATAIPTMVFGLLLANEMPMVLAAMTYRPVDGLGGSCGGECVIMVVEVRDWLLEGGDD